MKKELTPREQQIRTGLATQNKIVQSLFGNKEKADKFMATAVKVANDYKLSECHPNSIIDACITVAQMNLDLSPALSHAYIVPFKKSVQLIISARGYTALLARTGWKIKSYIVNEEDQFDYIIDGFEESIKFKKNIDAEKETFKYAVALAKSPDGTLYVEVMNAKQIDKHRKVSSNQTTINKYTSEENRKLINEGKPVGVWADWFNEMATKTVIKKLVKSLPIGEDIATAIEKDDKPIEAEIEEAPIQKETNQSFDLNSIGNIEKKEDSTIDIEIETKTESQQMKEALVSKGVSEEKAETWCMNNAETISTFLADPASIDVVVEELLGF